jgi:hypothetical protein
MTRAALTFVVLAGCGGTMDDDDAPPPPAIAVEIGRIGRDGFSAIPEHSELVLEPGAQGGFHVTLVHRIPDLPVGSEVSVERETRREDTGALVARARFTSRVGEDGTLEKNVPVFLCPAPVGIPVADEALAVRSRITVELEGGAAEGGAGEGSVSFVPRCPADFSAFCDQICR